MGKKQEKGKKGEAVEFYSRKQAMRHLQLSFTNFLRICRVKGIYPSEPNNLKAAGKGDTRAKIYYKRKDINLLLHEPVIEKYRQIRTYSLKLKKAKERNDKERVLLLQKCKPRYTLHHIVKELYPTREDALRNLDDCLKSIFLFATFPKMTQFNAAYIKLCKRLKLEFMNYCIAKQAVRKAFFSVKGVYVEVEIHGIPIRWLMPHQHVAMSLPASCNYRMMADQVEFDSAMLGSLLFNLYTEAGLFYPPKFQMESREDGTDWSTNDILASMAHPLAAEKTEDLENRLASLNELRYMDEDVAAVMDNEVRVSQIKSLFRDKKVFLNREVPREIFCFLLRSCGAQVSWDAATGTGSPFPETDPDIEYHVIDRPLANPNVTRFYVQPQFVFDSINAARLLPVRDYMPGVKLVAHLSPWADFTKGYVPPEYQYLQGEIDADALYKFEQEEDDEDVVEECDFANDNEGESEEETMEVIESKEIEKPSETLPAKTKQPRISKEALQAKIDKNKETKLLEMNLPKKRINLYNKMKHAEKTEKSKVENLKRKRQESNKKRFSVTKK